MRPKVSVLIAVYNGVDVLGRQLDALAGQTYEGSLEVIVADNRSLDGTAQLIHEKARELAIPIVYTRAFAKQGAGYAVNEAARAATGEVFLICDSDDIATPEWAELMVEALERHRLVGGRLLPFTHVPGDRPATEARTNVDDWRGYCRSAATANVGITRAFFEELGGIDETFVATYDVDLAARAFEHGSPLGGSEGAMWYRQRADLMEWSRHLAWCVSWEIAVQERRRQAMEAVGGYQSAFYCLKDLLQQVLDPRRWPRSRVSVPFWQSQTIIKMGRVDGHLRKHARLRAGGRDSSAAVPNLN